MEPSIHWSDWTIFAAVLLISLLVGVYQACAGGKQKTSGEYLLGNRQLPFIPTTISLMVSFISTNSIIGYAAEIYTYGAQNSMSILGYMLGVLMSIVIFIPLFYPLRLVSVNEYLLLRFNSRVVLILGSFLTVGAAINYAGVVLYGAAAAIEAMSGFSSAYAILLSGVVCTIYTSIGGIKAVIWTDVFQAIIIMAGVTYVTISGVKASAGFSHIWEINKAWNRLNFFDFDPDPTKRLNFYGCVFGTAFTCAGVFGYIQSGVQRYASLPTIQQAKWSVFATIPGHIIVNILSCFSGLVLFSYYADIGCDPLKAGYIPSPNHILPYFMATEIGTPVLTGLFLSSLIASSLSTASSSLNSSGANTWEDVLKYWYPDISEERKAFWLKILVAGYGVVAMVVAFAITLFSGLINQIINTVSSCLQGPAAGLFFIGAFIPWVNSKGAIVGSISGFIFGLWCVIGSFYSSAQWQPMPSSIENCTTEIFSNVTTAVTSMPYNTTIIDFMEEGRPEITGISRLYNVSFMWKREVVTAFTVGVAILVSLVTGIRKPKSIPPHLVHPIIRRFVGKDITKEDIVKDSNGLKEETEFLNGKTAKDKEMMELQSEDERKKFDVTAT